MKLSTILSLIALSTILFTSGAESWWGRRRRRRRSIVVPPPTSCTPRNCVYTWGTPSLCNSAGKYRQYANVVSAKSCGGLACPEFREQSCSQPNKRYAFNIDSNWSTGATNKLSIVLKEDQTDSVIIEICFATKQTITSAWPLAMHYVGEEGKCFYFIKRQGYLPMKAGDKILANYISTRKEGEPITKPFKIALHGNCVIHIADARISSSDDADDRCNKDEQLFEDAIDCTKYYQCVSTGEGLDKKATSMSCAPGTKWDDDYKTCVHGDCGDPKMRDTMCEGSECPANMYQETLYPAYLS